VHIVAAPCGHDPAVLLRSYAKRTRKADTSAAAVIALARGVLGNNEPIGSTCGSMLPAVAGAFLVGISLSH
jgi:hypothetical protein